MGGVRHLLIVLAIVALLSLGSYLSVPWSTPSSIPQGPAFGLGGSAPPSTHAPTAPSMMATVSSITPNANASNFNPYCYPLNASLCISIATQSTPGIIPIPPSHDAPYMPNATDNITLILKSMYQLIPPGTVYQSGPKSPIALNVTGTLWNGDPYMCTCDNSVWHSNGQGKGGTGGGIWWTAPTALQGVNKTYPYWYQLQILPRNGFGQQQFFPGETVFWHIYIVTLITKNTTYQGKQVGPEFQYRLAGAWPFSPWPGALQYAGPNASTADLNLHYSPLSPNWNDSVIVSISLSGASVTNRTQIGVPPQSPAPFVQVNELWPNDTPMVVNATYLFPTPPGVNGVSLLNLSLPASLTQVAGAKLTFQVTAADSAKAAGPSDFITLPPVTIIVSGNGSFPDRVFDDDLVLNATVNGRPINLTLTTDATTTVIGPGYNLSLRLDSRSLSTSIQSAEILYTFAYAALGETARVTVPMVRINSTSMHAIIPSMPLGAVINFTVQALDYGHTLVTSSSYSYRTQTLSEWKTAIPLNETFFFVYVFNNQSQTYLSGAVVQIRQTSGQGYNTVSSTRFGVAYPNSTGNDYFPLLLPANQSYNISVTPNPGSSVISAGHIVEINFLALPEYLLVNQHRPLARGSDYVVLLRGNSLYFWLNGTLPTTQYAQSAGAGGPTLIAMTVGLVGAAAVSFVVWIWFREVQERRRAEEKRVTL